MAAVNPIPEGYHTVTPHLIVQGAGDAIEFYKRALGAEELFRMPGPGGAIMHAELQVGSSRIMLCDEFPGMEYNKSPASLNGSAVTLSLYVEDADAAFNRAVEAGATATMPPMDAFWGDRYGKFRDPFGHEWAVMQHIKDLTPEEIQKGAEEWMKNAPEACG